MENEIKDKRRKVQNRKETSKRTKVILIILVIVISAVLTILIFRNSFDSKEKYLLSTGTVEKSIAVNGYVIKDEQVIKTEKSKTIVPVVGEGKKVKKDGVVATYNTNAITDKSARLEKLDKEILSAMANIPQIFSSDIKSIEESIGKASKEIMQETSYNKIQENKKSINDLITKKATIIGELSPAGAHIKELIEERNKLENEITSSKDNIVSNISGIVSYKLDNLEEKITFNNINELTIESLENMTKSTKGKTAYGIKVVNNFKAYLMFQINEEDMVEGVKEGQKKYIRLLDENIEDIPIIINKIEKNDKKYDITVELTQSIEYFVNKREIAVDFIWWSYVGYKAPNQAIIDKEGIQYLTVYRNDSNVEIPVKVLKTSEKFSIIENYNDEELVEKNITSNYKIKLYDEIIM